MRPSDVKELRLVTWGIAAGIWRSCEEWRLLRAVGRANRALQALAISADEAAASLNAFIESASRDEA